MVVTCDIQFEQNSAGIYLAGQNVSGTVTLIADKPKNVNGVLLQVNGAAYTSWNESTSDSSSTNKDTAKSCSGEENYIASTKYLLGSEEAHSVVIESGKHTFNFECLLPISCPSSFEGSNGHIRYTVDVILVRPWHFDQTFTKAFTVLRVMDLNFEPPQLRLTVDEEVQTTFCCDPCRTDPLKLHLSIPQSGYVSGQNIPVTVIVTNDSKTTVREMEVSLVMLVCYYCDDHISTEMERFVVTKIKGETVQKYCKKLFNYLINVPATPSTSMNACRLIQIAYQIEVEAKIQGLHANQVLCVPVIIGNVPLTGAISQQPTSSVDRGLSDAPSKEHVLSSMSRELPWAAVSNIPPPSYETAPHMFTLKLNTNEPRDFAPKYPVFQMASPNATTSIQIEDNKNKHDFVNFVVDVVDSVIDD